MERRKRVYSIKKDKNHLINAVMLTLSVLIVASGFISKDAPADFLLESLPQETSIPLDEVFDETITETVVELPAETWYALQVGAFENEETATQSSIAFQKRGAAGYLWMDGRYRVLAAAYPDKEDAQMVRSQLRDQHSIDSYLYPIEFPAISMKLRGMRGQIEILQASFIHARELIKHLQLLSIQMDRQEVSTQDALEQFEAMSTQIELVLLRLRQRFEAPIHVTVQGFIDYFENYILFCNSFSADQSSAAAGMKLKYQLFETLRQLQMIYRTLNHT